MEYFNTGSKIVIAGFPGVGKSYCAQMGRHFVDLESSDYHWIEGANGKQKHPEWPANYIRDIKALINESDRTANGDIQYVFVSTHDEVVTALVEEDLPMVIVAPKTKETAIARYARRGSPIEFIQKLEDNWDDFMNDVHKHSTVPVIETDLYLYDILQMFGIFRFLLLKIEEYRMRVEDDACKNPSKRTVGRVHTRKPASKDEDAE